MSGELLALDTSVLPKPSDLCVSEDIGGFGRLRLVIATSSVQAARAWAQALGIVLKDTGVNGVRQESGVLVVGPLRVHLIGTESGRAGVVTAS